jgi:hypothetical protein
MMAIDPLISEGIRDAVLVAAIIGTFGITRRWLTRELRITKAAVFRLLKSNRTQGKALEVIAECQRVGKCNGSTDEAIAAVKRDRTSIYNWLNSAAMGQVPVDDNDDENDDE